MTFLTFSLCYKIFLYWENLTFEISFSHADHGVESGAEAANYVPTEQEKCL